MEKEPPNGESMEKILVIYPEKCIGCSSCELACSFQHTGEFRPTKSRISAIRWPKAGVSVPLTCLQCEDPSCMKVCMVGAITKDKETGLVSINQEKCIGCRLCTAACPFGNINYDPEEAIVFKCDLCDGEPQCVEFCPNNAIEYREATDALLQRKKKVSAKFAEILEEVR